jgi:hypothetical protein
MSSDRQAQKSTQEQCRRRAADAVGEFEKVAREILAAEQHVAPEAKVDAVELPVVLGFSGGDTRLAAEFRLAESEKLIELLRGRVRDALLNAVAFQRGRVYCLRCENSLCAHSSPPTSRSVFAGYEETGRPEWVELDKLLHRKGARGSSAMEEGISRADPPRRVTGDSLKFDGRSGGVTCSGSCASGTSSPTVKSRPRRRGRKIAGSRIGGRGSAGS